MTQVKSIQVSWWISHDIVWLELLKPRVRSTWYGRWKLIEIQYIWWQIPPPACVGRGFSQTLELVSANDFLHLMNRNNETSHLTAIFFTNLPSQPMKHTSSSQRIYLKSFCRTKLNCWLPPVHLLVSSRVAFRNFRNYIMSAKHLNFDRL